MAYLLTILICCISLLSFPVCVSATTPLMSEEGMSKDNTKISEFKCIDHGVFGALFPVDEEDMIEVLKKRLLLLKESGKLEGIQNEFQEKAKKSVLEPRAVSHITPTTKTRVFYVDPTLVIEGDIRLPETVPNGGHLLAKKGDRINPLHTLKPHKGLLFIDGDIAEQREMALQMADKFDIVLVKGKPLEFEATSNRPIFFDQGGVITKRYGINHVPAKMEVEGDRLKFTEFPS